MTWTSATTSVATINTRVWRPAWRRGRRNDHGDAERRDRPDDVLTVTAATLQSIAVTPANPSIAKGPTQQFTATGTYSDSSTQNLTSQVTWARRRPQWRRSPRRSGDGVAVGTATITAR